MKSGKAGRSGKAMDDTNAEMTIPLFRSSPFAFPQAAFFALPFGALAMVLDAARIALTML